MDLMAGWLDSLADLTGLHNSAILVFGIVLVALLVDYFQRRLFKRLGAAAVETENIWDDALTGAAPRPLSLSIWIVGVWLGIHVLQSPGETSLLGSEVIAASREVGMLTALGWFLFLLVKGVETGVIRQGEQRRRKVDPTTVKALSRIMRVAVIVTVGLGILDTLGFSISGLLAAGGIGGLALGLAAKDLLANFFGGLTIYMDRPFTIGDWIRSPDRDIEGVVEDIGWRQSVIRRFDKRPMYVPNSVFSTIAVENPSRMSHRRINEVIGIRYDDFDAMEGIVTEVRHMLETHEEIDEAQTLMVNFNVFSASSLDFFIYCFTKTVDWATYHQVKQDVLLKIGRIVVKHGAEIAFPTSTIHLKGSREFAGLIPASESEGDEQ